MSVIAMHFLFSITVTGRGQGNFAQLHSDLDEIPEDVMSQVLKYSSQSFHSPPLVAGPEARVAARHLQLRDLLHLLSLNP